MEGGVGVAGDPPATNIATRSGAIKRDPDLWAKRRCQPVIRFLPGTVPGVHPSIHPAAWTRARRGGHRPPRPRVAVARPPDGGEVEGARADCAHAGSTAVDPYPGASRRPAGTHGRYIDAPVTEAELGSRTARSW